MGHQTVNDRPDFTGYWRILKHDNLDVFLKEAGIPWILRKVLSKYGSQSVDVIKHQGITMKISSVNAKTSWTRTLQEGREIHQKDAEGNIVKTTCWWDGQFLKTRMEGGRRGVVETWRSVDAGLMLVKTTLKPTAGREVSVIFYLEEMSIPGVGDARQIDRDLKRIGKATSKDNCYAQKLLQNPEKWKTPADRLLTATADTARKEGIVMTSSSHSPLSGSVSPRTTINPHLQSEAAPPPHATQHNLTTSFGQQPSRVMSSGALSDAQASLSKHSIDGEAESGAAQPDKQVIIGSLHRRAGSLGQISDSGPEKSSTSITRQRMAPDSLEAQLILKLQDYSENRSITSVLPVENPLASDEPELLQMSPEEAEGTQLKLQELEREAAKVALERQKLAAGRECCCCTFVFHSYVIPSYIRVWDL